MSGKEEELVEERKVKSNMTDKIKNHLYLIGGLITTVGVAFLATQTYLSIGGFLVGSAYYIAYRAGKESNE